MSGSLYTTVYGSGGAASPNADLVTGTVSVGAALPTNPQSIFAVLPQAVTATANQSYYRAVIQATGGAVTVPTGTAAIVASLAVQEPNITATGTVTAASTVYIKDAPTEGGLNYALWVDAGVTRLDGNLDFGIAAASVLVIANTAAALAFSDGTTNIISLDTRNTLKNINSVTILGQATTIASEGAAHVNASLSLAAKTLTYTGGTGTTSQFGGMLNVGVLTITDSTSMTLSAASAVHINAIAAAGGSLTISASYMISTSVAGCFLTNAGVWTDQASARGGKMALADADPDAIGDILDQVKCRTWKYRPEVHGDDKGRQRVGIVGDELPDALLVPGNYPKEGISAGVVASFCLAAIKHMHEEIKGLKAQLATKHEPAHTSKRK